MQNPFFLGILIFLFADPHYFRFLIFIFLAFLIPLYHLRYNEFILYFKRNKYAKHHQQRLHKIQPKTAF